MHSLQIDGVVCDCSVSQEYLTYQTVKKEVCIAIDDIIGIERNESRKDKNSKKWIAQIHYIKRRLGKPEWQKASIKITGKEEVCQAFLSDLQHPFEKVDEKRPKKVLVLINPIGGKATAKEDYKKTIQPLFELARMSCDVIVSERAKHIPDVIAAYDWSALDAIVILGGDGTCSEVITTALKRVHTEKGIDYNDERSACEKFTIPISVIPAGTGNGLAKNLYNCYDITTAALHAIKGKTCDYNVNGVYCDGKLVAYSCLLFAYGLFGDMIHFTERLRWMRRARYVLMVPGVMFFRSYRYFDAKINLKVKSVVSSQEDGASSETVEKEETMEGSYMNFILLPCNVIMGEESSQDHSGLMLFHNCRALHLIRIMKAMYLLNDLRVFPNNLTVKKVSDLNLRVTVREQNPLNHIINIDGEVHNITKPEFITRTCQGAVKLFGALNTVTAQNPEESDKQGD